jgi:putative ABC transport system permease protein
MSGSASSRRGLRLFRALLLAYPPDFRRRFEAEMVALFEERSAAAGRSALARLAFWRSIAIDMARSAMHERWPDRTALSLRDVGYDARLAWRSVSRAPLLAVFVIALMALAIGSTTSVFSIVHAVLLRPFPFADPDRLVMIWERRGPENTRNSVGAHEFPEWKASSHAFAQMAAITFDRDYNLTGAGEPVKLVAVRVTSDFFPVLGVEPIAGRVFTPEEDQPGRGAVVVISEGLWRSRFGADPSIAGRTVQLNGTPHTIVGVMPAAFTFPDGPGGAAPDMWAPIAEPIQLYRGRHYLYVVARLNPGVTVAQAQSELDAISARVSRELPQFSAGHGVNVQPLHAEIVQGHRRALLVVFAAVALVLLIGCCNVANLLLARAAERQQEIAVRLALGATRLRMARQLLAEGGLLAAVGGGAGLLLAAWLIALARTRVAADLPRVADAGLNPIVVLFAFTVTAITAIVFGLVPLGQAMRVQVADRLKHGTKGVARASRQPLRSALVIVEVALTMIVATGAGLFLQSLHNLARVLPGFTMHDVVAMEIALPPSRYRTAPQQRAFFDEAVARVAGLPGVASVAATNLVPHGPGRSGIGVAIEGRPQPRTGDQASANYRVVSAGYFRTLGIPLVAGRLFNEGDARLAVPLIRWFPQQPLPPGFDRPQPPPVAVINETTARRFWAGEDAIGRRFTVLSSPPITVVGIVRDARDQSLSEPPAPEFFLSDAQEPQSKMALLARVTNGGDGFAAAARARIWSIDAELPVTNIRTLAQIVDGNLSLYRSVIALMGIFAIVALALMAIGVYAVVAYTAQQRTFEIGVRLALGAQRRDVRRMVVTSGAGLSVAGIAIGLAGAYALARFASTMLYEVTPADPFTYGALAALLMAVTIAATWLPAYRAQRVDPVAVLRNE